MTSPASRATASPPRPNGSGTAFTLVDTGGIGLLRGEKSDDVIIKAALEQVEMAIEAANVIILVVNVQEGVVPLDREVAQRLRRSGKPVLVAVNKVDTSRAEKGADEFAELGFEKIFPVSAIHGEGIDEFDGSGGRRCCRKSTSPSDSRRVRRGRTDRRRPARTLRPSTFDLRPSETGHRRPAQRRQILHHQRADTIRARHRLAHSRHHARCD